MLNLKDWTFREKVLLFLVLILLAGFLIMDLSMQKTVESYEYTYKQNYLNCLQAIRDYQSPVVDVFGRQHNETLNNLSWSLE